MDYHLLKEVLPLLQVFQQERGENQTANDFMRWCAQKMKYEDEIFRSRYDENIDNVADPHNNDTVLAMLIIFLYRHGKIYLKKALPEDLSTEEFSYLALLARHPGITKIELISQNIHEKPTGTEIINRLLQKGYASQAENPGDRRSRCLYITPAGKALLDRNFPYIHKAAKIIGASLSHAEKRQLIALLEKLHFFHKPIFEEDRESELEAVLQKYF